MITRRKESWIVCLKVGYWNELEKLYCYAKNGPLQYLERESNKIRYFNACLRAHSRNYSGNSKTGIQKKYKIKSSISASFQFPAFTVKASPECTFRAGNPSSHNGKQTGMLTPAPSLPKQPPHLTSVSWSFHHTTPCHLSLDRQWPAAHQVQALSTVPTLASTLS
jgi:hypothetical protein